MVSWTHTNGISIGSAVFVRDSHSTQTDRAAGPDVHIDSLAGTCLSTKCTQRGIKSSTLGNRRYSQLSQPAMFVRTVRINDVHAQLNCHKAVSAMDF